MDDVEDGTVCGDGAHGEKCEAGEGEEGFHAPGSVAICARRARGKAGVLGAQFAVLRSVPTAN
jgi:hypothetical protein